MNKSKKIFGLVFSGALLAAGFVFAGVSVNNSSVSELSAKAGDYCTSNPNTDCRSSATGNIYPHMEAADF